MADFAVEDHEEVFDDESSDFIVLSEGSSSSGY